MEQINKYRQIATFDYYAFFVVAVLYFAIYFTCVAGMIFMICKGDEVGSWLFWVPSVSLGFFFVSAVRKVVYMVKNKEEAIQKQIEQYENDWI